MGKQSTVVTSITAVVALGLGVAIGSYLNTRGPLGNQAASEAADPTLANKSLEELADKLSLIMLPEDEFQRLGTAIDQTAKGMLSAQAQASGISVTEAVLAELKKSVEEKYSRKYFSGINATSMQELSKEDLITILNFYNTTAGQNFLKQSPKILQTTMTTVQADLSTWLPKTVETLLAKLKGGDQEKGNAEQKPASAAPVDPAAKPASEAVDS